METKQALLASPTISSSVETDDEFDLDIKLLSFEHVRPNASTPGVIYGERSTERNTCGCPTGHDTCGGHTCGGHTCGATCGEHTCGGTCGSHTCAGTCNAYSCNRC